MPGLALVEEVEEVAFDSVRRLLVVAYPGYCVCEDMVLVPR